MDLLHLIMEKIESIDETFEGLQYSVLIWGKILIAIGGALKPQKCFYTLLDLEWNARGKWKYKLHHEDTRAQLYVPMPDETHENIEHVSAHEAKETLGIYTCPSGAYKKSLEIMAEKAQGWIDIASEGKLHWRMACFRIDRQFWPKVSYGLCCNLAPLPQLQYSFKNSIEQWYPWVGLKRMRRRRL